MLIPIDNNRNESVYFIIDFLLSLIEVLIFVNVIIINHPVKNFSNFCHPFRGGEFWMFLSRPSLVCLKRCLVGLKRCFVGFGLCLVLLRLSFVRFEHCLIGLCVCLVRFELCLVGFGPCLVFLKDDKIVFFVESAARLSLIFYLFLFESMNLVPRFERPLREPQSDNWESFDKLRINYRRKIAAQIISFNFLLLVLKFWK